MGKTNVDILHAEPELQAWSFCCCISTLSVAIHCKKELAVFPSPAGMSLIKLFLGGNNLVFSRPERVWSVTSRLGTGKWLTLFYSVNPFTDKVTHSCLWNIRTLSHSWYFFVGCTVHTSICCTHYTTYCNRPYLLLNHYAYRYGIWRLQSIEQFSESVGRVLSCSSW